MFLVCFCAPVANKVWCCFYLLLWEEGDSLTQHFKREIERNQRRQTLQFTNNVSTYVGREVKKPPHHLM